MENCQARQSKEASAASDLFWVAFAVATATSKLLPAVKTVNAVLGSLRLEKHPDKTFIGKIERGFDFLGCHFSRDGPRVAKATIQGFIDRAPPFTSSSGRNEMVPPRLGCMSGDGSVGQAAVWARRAGQEACLGLSTPVSTPSCHEAQPGEADAEEGEGGRLRYLLVPGQKGDHKKIVVRELPPRHF